MGPATTATAAQARANRRTRLRDAARLLPFLGALLLLLPDLALSGGEAGGGATAPWLLYLLVAWSFLIALAFWISHLHLKDTDPEAPPGPREG